MTNEISLKTVNELLDKYGFFIPSYQRGYRWGEQQVKNLLDDIYEFMNERSSDFYCLQPLVTRKTDRLDEHQLPVYEVIDGQQRLTTIALILLYLNSNPYTVEYETRIDSMNFLKNISEEVDNDNSSQNIDYYFFKNAFLTIKEWFNAPRENSRTLPQKFAIALGEDVKVIWYEVDQQVEVREVFSRLNIGKIPLTNAELIKAYILSEIKDERKLELAHEWDQIERRLQNDRLWYFINPSTEYINRIEFLFDIYTNNILKKHHDQFYTFYKLQEDKDVEQLWLIIKSYISRFEEWFDNRELYHYLGYLTQSKSIIHYMNFYDSEDVKDKNGFQHLLKNEIRSAISNVNLEELEYGSDNHQIKRLLLLFNVLTTLKQKNYEARFPFDRYVKEKWSIEHIHAQNTEGLNTKEQWYAWLQDAIELLQSLIVEENSYLPLIERLELAKLDKQLTHDQFEQLSTEFMIQTEKHFGSNLHSLGNLALLDQGTNSALGNRFYPQKYQELIKHDKEGSFIPLCTRNAFMKYYSPQVESFQIWSEQDRNNYFKAISQTIKNF